MATRAGGNPFFAEEMARMLAEEGTVETAELPGTVQALLAARLDSLEPHERQLVQQAAVVGRTFWEGSLEQVADDAGFDLHEALTSLQEKDLVVPSTGSQLAGEQEYAFKHVLIRDVAYGMLPKSVRGAKHFEVGPLHRGPHGRPHRRGGHGARRALRARRRPRRGVRPAGPRAEAAPRQGAPLPRGGG